MGTFHYPIEVGDPQGQRFEMVEAVVDSGASYTVVAASLLRRLGVMPLERWPFRLADDRQVEYEVGQTQVRIDGRVRFTVVVFGDEGATPLLGAVTLEEFGLAVDPVGRRLVPTPGLLLATKRMSNGGPTIRSRRKMKNLSSISELPSVPAVYAMYGGRGRGLYVAYVGIADSLRRRLIQHLVNRDSSIATGTAAVGLNPDYVTEVRCPGASKDALCRRYL